MTSKVVRWGNSLAVPLPKGIVQAARLREGETLELAVTEIGTITLQPVRGRLRLQQFVAGITPDNHHAATEWAAASGNEVW